MPVQNFSIHWLIVGFSVVIQLNAIYVHDCELYRTNVQMIKSFSRTHRKMTGNKILPRKKKVRLILVNVHL